MAENANAEKNILIKFATAVCSSIFDSHDKLVSLMQWSVLGQPASCWSGQASGKAKT